MGDDTRPRAERVFFTIFEMVMMVARAISIVFFVTQSCRYSRLPKEQRDRYSVITFSFFALSLISLFCQRAMVMADRELSKRGG